MVRMPARIPTQHKSPFALDGRPLREMSSPHAGLLATSRAFRSLKLPDFVAANLKLKQRKRGCSEAEYIEALVLLQTAGGDCPEDIQLLSGDPCLERGLGFKIPAHQAVVWVNCAWESDFQALLTGAIWVWAGAQTGYV